MSAKEIGNDIFSALSKAVIVTGPLATSDKHHHNTAEIDSAARTMTRTLSDFDKQARRLSDLIPDKRSQKEDLDAYIKRKNPSNKGYTDKRYKMVFQRLIRKIPHMIKSRDNELSALIDRSMKALVLYKVVYSTILSASSTLLGRADHAAGSLTENSDPDEFDQEQDDNTNDLISSLSGSEASDRDQQRTNVQMDRKTRSKNPTGKASDYEEYTAYETKYNKLVKDATASVEKHSEELKKAIAAVDAETFSAILYTQQRATRLAQAYAIAARNAKNQMYPGTAAACTAIQSALFEVGRALIAGTNKSKKIRKKLEERNKKYESYINDTTPITGEN